MDKESKLPSATQTHDHKQKGRQRKEAAKLHITPSPHLILPDPYVPDQSLKGNLTGVNLMQTSNTNEVPAGRKDVLRSHESGNHSVREALHNNVSNNDSHAQSRAVSKNSVDKQRKGFKSARSAPKSAEKSKPAQANSVPFEVKMNDFPELAGVSQAKVAPPVVQRACWGPTPRTTSPLMQTSAFTRKSGRREFPAQPYPQRNSQTLLDTQEHNANAKPDSSAASPGKSGVTSWANIASQPPKKPVPKERTIGSNEVQIEEIAVQPEDGALGKKKRKKKKKKAKGAHEDGEAESEEPVIYHEPPKIEDEEEFPGLTLALTVNAAKLCNEENQREGVQPDDQIKTQPTETARKGQKAEKVSGKKSKIPVQLDIGNMLATLEKKQQSQKAKQDSKSVILSVGGGLPVVQKQPLVQKKPPWQQDKIAHNPLDSTSPLVKKGKQREVPKAKKPTPLKKVILKEREERKQRRLLEERGLLPENEFQPDDDAAEEEQCRANAADEVTSSTEKLNDLSALNTTNQMVKEPDEQADKEQTILPVPCSASRPKIHSRKFRDYCSQMLSKDVDDCVTALLKELVRFQDRLYQKDPMKARMKRRIVMGLREVLKHLKLRKVKCVVISPNCERIQSKGGLDEALYTIIDTCREQGVPFVFALSRKALGRCVNKAVPVSLVGIFNYDGAQDFYHKMIELSSEARTAYEVMVTNLEQTNQAEVTQSLNTEEELQFSSLAEKTNADPEHIQPEEPEYIKIWKKMLEKDCNHKFLNFEEELSSMRLESECIENNEDEKS